MGAICRIYEQTDHGVKVIAQIRDGKITGAKAASIHKLLQQYGFPGAPLEAVIDQLLLSNRKLGAALISQSEEDT